MKKLISVILSTVMLSSLCACTPSGTDSTNGSTGTTGSNETTKPTEGGPAGQLLVGFGKANMTPNYSVPIAAVGNSERYMSKGFKSYIYQIALAITDISGNTAILIASDQGSLHDWQVDEIRTKVADETKVPMDNIIVSCLHQHSCPDTRNSNVPTSEQYYKELFVPKAVEAAKLAMENRAVTTAVQNTALETNNMNFIRHYIMADGTYAGNNFGDLRASVPVKHATEVDNQLQMVKFVRKGQTTQDGQEAKDIVLTNFQGHLTWGINTANPSIHSDMAGVYRDELEKKLDCHAIYFSGAGGNSTFNSEIKEENKSADYKEHGERLAKQAAKAADDFVDVAIGDIKVTNVTYTAKCNHAEEERYEEAKALQEAFNSDPKFDTSLFKKNGFESQHHVNAIVAHKSLPETRDMRLTAIALGDVAFIAAPYEMFSINGENIKAASPFKSTIVTTLAGGHGYLPTMEAWDYGCYEQYSSNYVRGTAEELEAKYIEMLQGIHG